MDGNQKKADNPNDRIPPAVEKNSNFSLSLFLMNKKIKNNPMKMIDGNAIKGWVNINKAKKTAKNIEFFQFIFCDNLYKPKKTNGKIASVKNSAKAPRT